MTNEEVQEEQEKNEAANAEDDMDSLIDELEEQQAQPENIEVFDSSHLGGHRFAPTMIDLPSGRSYGHLTIPEITDFKLTIPLLTGPKSLYISLGNLHKLRKKN